jgi:DNA-binding NarL/FixJ family response regulator
MTQISKIPATDVAKYRIVLVDDHPIVREGLEARLAQESDLVVVGSAADAAEAMQMINTLSPDLVIADLALQGRPGLELVKDLAQQHPTLPVLVLSLHDEHLWAERVLRAGAKGYITKTHASTKVVEAIHRLLEGNIWVSQQVEAALQDDRGTRGKNAANASSPLARLSDRELEIFHMIGGGVSVRDIAGRLFLSPKTVEVHREHIKEKLGLKSSAELLRYAVTAAMEGQPPSSSV